MRSIAMPEFVQGRKDIPSGPWTVEAMPGGGPVGGTTDIAARRMRVPIGTSDLARSTRAHELMHARVSPEDKAVIAKLEAAWGMKPGVIEAAEEYRVNTLIYLMGFNVDVFADGSHVTYGKTWAADFNWNSLVLTAALFAGYKPTADLLRGVKQVNDDYYQKLRQMVRDIRAAITFLRLKNNPWMRSAMASTKPIDLYFGVDNKVRLPQGFSTHTKAIAEVINRFMDDPIGNEDHVFGEEEKDSDPIPITEPGKFAALKWDKIPMTPYKGNNIMRRRRRPSDTGRHPRRIARMLTDQKVFDRKVRTQGGMIVIDQSGSMGLSESDIHEMLEIAPGCTVVGYSHKPGSTTIPNCWIIAKDGKIAQNIPGGNTGNGVDGPIIKSAATQRRSGEPFIWVCDGIVTDGAGDNFYPSLNQECIDLVKRHKIHMVETPEEAVVAIRKASKGVTLPTRLATPLR